MRPVSDIPSRKQTSVDIGSGLLVSRTLQDFSCLLLAAFAGLLCMETETGAPFESGLLSSEHVTLLRFLTLFALHSAFLLSQLQSRTRTVGQLVRGTVLAYASVLLLIGLLGLQPLLSLPLFGAVLAALVLLALSTLADRKPRGSFLQSALQRNVIVLGTKRTAPLLQSHLMAQQERHLQVVLTVDAEDMLLPEQRNMFETWLLATARQHFADEIAVCGLNAEAVEFLIVSARRNGLAVRLVPDLLSSGGDQHPATEFLGHLPTFCVNRSRTDITAVIAKRALDISSALFVILLLLPFLLLLLLLIKLDSRGPVLYRSQRVGRKGRIFWCWKFRTMVPHADQLKESLQHMNERDGVLFKITNDPRITRIGKHLRKYSLDELPQLLNVLKGDMSLVGPRPPLAEEVAQYDAEQRQRLAVHPGITGLWQVEARTNPSFDRYMELDLRYVREWNLKLDLQILLRTVQVVIAGTGQ